MNSNPKLILLFCGKRKSGKDFLTDWLQKNISEKRGDDEKSVIIRLSGPLKQCYAEDHGLDYSRLLDSSDYKEKYRKDMISWSEKIRNENPSYFCHKAIDMYKGTDFPIWIVSDCRRPTDFEFFQSQYQGKTVKKIRIWASQDIKNSRGFIFQPGVDDAQSECGLDHTNCDFVIENNGDTMPEILLKDILEII